MIEPRDISKPVGGPAARRSLGSVVVARALWYVKPAVAELRSERLAAPRPGDVRVATQFSAISRGSERLAALGNVPKSEWARMRAPLQSGDFPFPIKYGYSAAGVIAAGPDDMVGRRVFALHPHQDHFQVPEAMVVPVPDDVPTKRATLAANMETALNAHWDAGTQPGDKVLVVGAGVVGMLVAHLARRIAGTDVAIVDLDAGKSKYADALGMKFAAPKDAPQDNRIVFHCSASGAGLDTAIEACAFEGRVIELSWYGDKAVSVHLGGTFHSRRLRIISSQVGHVSGNHRASTTHRVRLQKAMTLLNDASLDVLVSDEIAFDQVAGALPGVWTSTTLPPVIRY